MTQIPVKPIGKEGRSRTPAARHALPGYDQGIIAFYACISEQPGNLRDGLESASPVQKALVIDIQGPIEISGCIGAYIQNSIRRNNLFWTDKSGIKIR